MKELKENRKVRTVAIALLCLALAGCSGKSVAGAESETVAEKTASEGNQIDVDLTVMSSTMVFSEVYNMMMTPDDYEGKRVKMSGQFALYEAEPGNESGVDYYFAVVIADATACCQQGIEFVWNGEHSFPEDYPEIGSEVTVTGVYETYMEGEDRYCHLLADSVEIGEGS